MNSQTNCQFPTGVSGRQSTGSLNQPTYTPFMMGSSYGPGFNRGPQRGVASTESVRACMQWPSSLEGNKGQSQGPTLTWNGAGNGSGAAPFNFFTGHSPVPTSYGGQQQQQQRAPMKYPQPTAYMQMQGSGGQGETMQPLSIPCQMGPLGSDPAQMIQPVEPLTIKVVAPPGGNPGGQFSPMQFQVGGQGNMRR